MRPPEVALKDRRPDDGAEFVFDEWLWVKVRRLKAGEMMEQEVHHHDHVTMVLGTVRLWIDDQDQGEVTDRPVKVRALAQHKFLAVTDAAIGCVHNLMGKGYPSIVEEN